LVFVKVYVIKTARADGIGRFIQASSISQDLLKDGLISAQPSRVGGRCASLNFTAGLRKS